MLTMDIYHRLTFKERKKKDTVGASYSGEGKALRFRVPSIVRQFDDREAGDGVRPTVQPVSHHTDHTDHTRR